MTWLDDPERIFGVSDVCRCLAKRGYGNLTVGRFLRKSSLFRVAARDSLLPEGFQQTSFRLSSAGLTAWERVHGQAKKQRRRNGNRKPHAHRTLAKASHDGSM